MSAIKSNPREIEATLIIKSENPKAIISKIAHLDLTGDYRLLHQSPKEIHDFYFDTQSHDLGSKGVALRLRNVGETYWITLKGPVKVTTWGSKERLEIENAWSYDALDNVLEELRVRGVKIQEQYSKCVYPPDTMKSLGLLLIQNREDHRQIRNIVHTGQENAILAEMAIDSVIYHFDIRDIHHYEVEIELKPEGEFSLIKNVLESLIAAFNPHLRKWGHGKLTTGKVIERMLKEGALDGFINPDNTLKPSAYNLINYYITQSTN